MNLNRRYLLAAAYTLTAFTLWVGSDTFIKLSGDTLPIPQQIVVELFVTILIVLAASFRGRGWREMKTQKPLFHLGRGMVGCVNVFCIFYSVTHLPLANFYALAFTLPFIISLISAVLFRERAGASVWAAIVIGFGGVLMAVNVNNYDSSAWPWLAVVCMLIGNIAGAIYAVTIKEGGRTESTTALIIYPEILAVAICSVILISQNEWSQDPKGLMYIAASGVLNGFATLLYTAAFRLSHKNALIAPFHYTQIIAGSLIGYLVWGDIPTINLWIGVIVIIAAGLYVIKHGASETEPPVAKAEPLP